MPKSTLISGLLTFTSTPGHGYFNCTKPYLLEKMPDYLLACKTAHKGWEEDCAWAILICYLHDIKAYDFTQFVGEKSATQEPIDWYSKAKETFKNWYPEEYQKYYGVTLQTTIKAG